MAEVISWDWRQQPDLIKLREAVRRVSGGACDLAEIDTGGDDYAVVIADHVVDDAEARELYVQQQYEDEEDRQAMRDYWADRDAAGSDG